MGIYHERSFDHWILRFQEQRNIYDSEKPGKDFSPMPKIPATPQEAPQAAEAEPEKNSEKE